MISNLLRRSAQHAARPKARPITFRPRLEMLEDRLAPATFTVNSTADTVAANLATGQDNAGNITLRSAVMAANSASNLGDDTIVLPAGTYTLTRAGAGEGAAATGDLDIPNTSGKLAVTGAGPGVTVIDAAGLDRVFHLTGANLELTGVTLRGGKVNGTGLEAFGGALLLEFGCTLTVRNCTISGNTSSGEGGAISYRNSCVVSIVGSHLLGNTSGRGGGIYSGGGTLTIIDSMFSGNSANEGGGIFSTANVTVSGSTFSGNSATVGGAIYAYLGTLTLIESTLRGNSASQGGGIYNYAPSGSAPASLIMSGCTLFSNSASDSGGALYNLGLATISNSTLSGNSAVFGAGAIAAVLDAGVVRIINCTITGNSAGSTGGGIWRFFGLVEVLNTIIAKNQSPGSPDFSGPATSLGHNLIGNSAGSSGFNGFLGDLIGVDPRLGPLADNGGPTLTHALLAGSPALDAGNSAGAPAIDQRGYNRLVAGPNAAGIAFPDIGAFEPQIWIPDIANRTTTEDTPHAFDFATPLGLANVSVVSSNEGLVPNANLSVTGAGNKRTLTITPLGNQSGATVITVTVDDGVERMIDTFTLTVAPVNDAPLLAPDGALTLQAIREDDFDNPGTRVSDLLLSVPGDAVSDADAGAFEGIAVIRSSNKSGVWQFSLDGGAKWTAFGEPSESQARLLAAGAFVRFVPEPDFNGTRDDLLEFRAWDQTSGTSGGTADVSINGSSTAFSAGAEVAHLTVLPANDPPTAVDNSASVAEDSFVDINVLGNDSSAPDEGETLSINSFTQAPHGVVSRVGNQLRYTPSPDFYGADSFTYTVSDGNGGSASAGVNITVNPVNDAPINIVPPAQKTKVNKMLTFSGSRLIAIADVDAAGGIVRVTLTVTNGTLTLGTSAGLSSVAGNGKAKITLTGTLGRINSALNGLRFKPKAGFRGKARLTLFTEDLGNSALGAPKSATDLMLINVV